MSASSPTAGFSFSYSSSVRHIVAFVTRFFMPEYMAWIICCTIWPTSLGTATTMSSSVPTSTFMHSPTLLTLSTCTALHTYRFIYPTLKAVKVINTWFDIYVLIQPINRKEFEERTFPHAYSYMVYQKDNTYYAKNGDTGNVEYSDIDAAKVIQYVVDKVVGDGGGKILIRRGVYNAYSQVWIKSTIGRVVRVIIEGEGGATNSAEESATRIRFGNLPLTNENSSTAIRVGYRYDDLGNEISDWYKNAVKIVIKDLSIGCADTRLRGIVIEGASGRFDLVNIGSYGCAYGVVLRGMAEAGIGGLITGSALGGGYRDVSGISGAALQIGDIVQGKVIANGVANLLIDNTGMLNIGYLPQNATLTVDDLKSLRPAGLRLIQGGRITVVNSHLHLGGWGWGYALHVWGSKKSSTQPITTSAAPYPSGDIEIYGTNFEGGAPKNTDNTVANVDNIFILQETDTGWVTIRESYFYGNGGVRMLFVSRRGRFRIENSRVIDLYGSVEIAIRPNTRVLTVGEDGSVNNTELFLISGTSLSVDSSIHYNGESSDALFSTADGSRSNPAILPTSQIKLWGNTMYYKLPAGTNVSAGVNTYNAHHAYAVNTRNLPNFNIQVLQGTPELIFIGATMDTTLPGFKLMFYAPSSGTTSQDVIIKIQIR